MLVAKGTTAALTSVDPTGGVLASVLAPLVTPLVTGAVDAVGSVLGDFFGGGYTRPPAPFASTNDFTGSGGGRGGDSGAIREAL